MIKIFKTIIFSFVLLSIPSQIFSWVFLWEMRDENSVSCCLHFNGIDICNPNKPCTRFFQLDLIGILDYINRLSLTDHAKMEPHGTILAQLKIAIKAMLCNPHQGVLYQIPRNISVRFYHDIIEADYAKSKDSKASQAKIKDKDFVNAFLAKMGLMQRAP